MSSIQPDKYLKQSWSSGFCLNEPLHSQNVLSVWDLESIKIQARRDAQVDGLDRPPKLLKQVHMLPPNINFCCFDDNQK